MGAQCGGATCTTPGPPLCDSGTNCYPKEQGWNAFHQKKSMWRWVWIQMDCQAVPIWAVNWARRGWQWHWAAKLNWLVKCNWCLPQWTAPWDLIFQQRQFKLWNASNEKLRSAVSDGVCTFPICCASEARSLFVDVYFIHYFLFFLGRIFFCRIIMWFIYSFQPEPPVFPFTFFQVSVSNALISTCVLGYNSIFLFICFMSRLFTSCHTKQLANLSQWLDHQPHQLHFTAPLFLFILILFLDWPADAVSKEQVYTIQKTLIQNKITKTEGQQVS